MKKKEKRPGNKAMAIVMHDFLKKIMVAYSCLS